MQRCSPLAFIAMPLAALPFERGYQAFRHPDMSRHRPQGRATIGAYAGATVSPQAGIPREVSMSLLLQ